MTLNMERKEIVSSGVSIVRGRPVLVETKKMTEEEVRALNKARLAIIKGVYNHLR
jgi:hypothetical protein